MVAAANTLAGVNLVNQYAYYIYDIINTSTLESGGEIQLSTSNCVYAVGITGFVASTSALFTVRAFTRRVFFIGGHTGIAIALILCIIFNEKHMLIPFLVFHGLMILSFQGSNGAGFWIYAGEVANEVAMGICLFVMLGSQIILSLLTPTILE